jgi:Ca2+-binding RTX toxin-like protein
MAVYNGTSANNFYGGTTGNDTINGNDGNDTLYGADGTDSITGGNGNDFLNGGGTGNDTLDGGAGNDTISGASGNNLILAGDGNDTVILYQGAATVSGGNGNDLYVIQGSSANIEDFQGHDTVDASGATGNTFLDLSLASASTVQGKTVVFNPGGTTYAPLDVQFLQDLTGSFGDDIANVRTLVPQIVDALQAVQSNIGFGLSSFRDKAVSPFGSTGDYVYNLNLAITNSEAALAAAYNAATAGGGNDTPESQLEALLHLALTPGEVGFRSGTARFVVLFSDAPFHVAGDGAAGGISTPNDGDAVLENEDYPAIAQLKAALEAANIIPIFAVTSDVTSSYADLVAQLGRGTTVTLSSDSSNIVAAITAGITTVTSTVIEDAIGGVGNDTLIGNAAANDLDGGDGNDILTGHGGYDTLTGGNGIDTANYSGETAPVYVELDPAYAGFQYGITYGDGTYDQLYSIENANGGAGNDTLRGNAGSNVLNGNAGNDGIYGFGGNDTVNGGAGNDLIDGGDGNDWLDSSAGSDTAIGGNGNDTFSIHGAAVVVEDFQGHDEIDASLATGNSYIDLTGKTTSIVQGQNVTLNPGGTTYSPLDVQFLQDLTGSFSDDITNVRTLVPQIVDALQAIQSNVGFGLSSFADKAVSPFGATGDYVYNLDLGITTNETNLVNAYNAVTIKNGGDLPESQLEALMHLALTPGEVGFRVGTARFVVLFTDAAFHVAGDGAAGGITTPNDGDAVLELEDYPEIAQLKAALEAANIIPIFAATSGIEASYQTLVTALGRGTTVTLNSDSSNIVAAITAGITTVTSTVIEDVTGGVGNDTLIGNSVDNNIIGNAGNDSLTGAAGNDTLDGGTGADSMVGGTGNDIYYVDNTGDRVTENVSEGNDTVFASVDFALSANVEVLTQTGAANIAGTGNGLNNLITGNSGANTLLGGGGNDTIDGGAGADSIDGGTGNDYLAGGIRWDTLIGGDGNDTLDGGVDNDQMYGNLGNDVFYVDHLGDRTYENLNEGIDTIISSIDFALVVNTENLYLVGAALTGAGNSLSNAIFGNGLNNTLSGALGNDSIYGGAGLDSITAGEGADSVFGEDGNDSIAGDAGADTIDGGAGNDTILGGERWDSIFGGAGDDSIDGGTENDQMYGGLGNDIFVVDNAGDRTYENVGEGADTTYSSIDWALMANVENLILTGSAVSGTGNGLANVITGNGAANKLTGNSGNDTLTGGAGADQFIFNAAAANGRDSIQDFVHNVDKLVFKGTDYGFSAGHVLTAAQFTVGAAAVGAAAQFIWDAGTDSLYWDSDGTGAAARVQLAIFDPTATLTASDLIFI